MVRLSDGKIVASAASPSTSTVTRRTIGANPIRITKPAPDAICYRASGREAIDADGAPPALEIALASTCGNDHNNTFATLYVEPHSLRPLDVKGSASTHEHLGYVKVSLDQTFAVFDGRSMPVALRVDVTGSGLMFWIQVHVSETYSDYQFLNSYPPLSSGG